MNISQLLQSTAYVRGYGPNDTFGKKKFGEIMLYNKSVKTKANLSIIEVSMMIRAVTDTIKPTKDSKPRPVVAHKVQIAISGVKQEKVSSSELIQRIKNLEVDGKKPYADLHGNHILSEVEHDTKFFEDKSIFKSTSDSYVIVDDHISKESEIQVWCSCSSYYWVFQYYNMQADVNIRVHNKYPGEYIHKTKAGWKAFKENKPMRNPGKNPGMCKHIMLLLAILMENETVSEARSVIKAYKANYSKFKKMSRMSKDSFKKLLDKFKSDNNMKKNQRNVAHTSFGYAKSTGNHKRNQQGFNSHMKWVSNPNNKNGGYWRMK